MPELGEKSGLVFLTSASTSCASRTRLANRYAFARVLRAAAAPAQLRPHYGSGGGGDHGRHPKDLATEKSKLNIAAFLHPPIRVTDFFRLVGRMRARKLEAEAKK